MTVLMKDDKHFPKLYRGSDAASNAAQADHFKLQRAHLVCLVLASLAGAIASGLQAPAKGVVSVIAVIFILGALAIFWIIRSRRNDKTWFDCRAVAESVKTATWRFVIGVPPFQRSLSNNEAEKAFIDELKDIRNARPGMEIKMLGKIENIADEITAEMRTVRKFGLATRKKIYLETRLINQKNWYLNKASFHKQEATYWVKAVVVLHILAVGLGIAYVTCLGWPLNPIPTIVAVAGALLTWTQSKRHDELAQSYSMAGQELVELKSLVDVKKSDKDFCELVKQVEEACSREHTMWCARREVKVQVLNMARKR